MQTFIDTVLKEEHDIHSSDKVFILPSRRAGSFIRRRLAQASSHTSFAPHIFSIEEFIAHISGLKTANTIDLTFKLYESYKEVVGDKSVSFQVFSTWAQPILSDFNEIDRYLLDPNQILNHLRDVKNISNHWSNATSDLVVNYLDFWNRLLDIYTIFIEKCIAQKAVHQGYVYRQAVENIEHYLQSASGTRHVFLGFNALNTSEQQLLQSFLSNPNNSVYWDAEETFVNNKLHEAGMFLRGFKSNWPYYKNHPFKWITNHYTEEKTIQTYAVSQNIHQAKTVGAILQDATIEQLNKTAIILGDESLLLPILNALPRTVPKVNVTMGIPLNKTPVSSFFELLIELKKPSSNENYYYKYVLALIEHPVCAHLMGTALKSLEQRIIAENKIFIQPEELINSIEETSLSTVRLLFEPWHDEPKKAVANILAIIGILKNTYKAKSPLYLEYIFGYYKAFNKLETILNESALIEDIATLIYFYREILALETVDLTGDQGDGLQIMGVLESRVLDFERVILTSVNEGILPSGKSQNSYIPYDLKRLYKLPTYAEKDAIYAYHFYHLLHRAKYAAIIYTTESKGIGSAEPSRFVKQLIQEGIHNIEHHIVTPPINKNSKASHSITKTPEILSKLTNLLEKGISPSALSTYLRNPLLFYEQYVLGIRESDQVEETVAANTMGTIVHNTLEEIYTPFIGSQLTIASIEKLLSIYKIEVKKQFTKEYGNAATISGKNFLIYEIVCRFIENYLKKEREYLKEGDKVIIRAIEENLYDIPLTKNIKLRGKVDLVEERNGDLRIIDYKTGKVIQAQLKIKDWEDLLLPEGKAEKAFQVLMYAYMMHKKKALPLTVNVGIISFKNLQAGFMPFHYDKNSEITEDVLKEFEKVLLKVTNEIMDPKIPFEERQ